MTEWVDCSCPIWGTPAKRNPASTGDYEEYLSPRAGGSFWMSGTAEASISKDKRVPLSDFILMENLKGSTPKIYSNEIQRISPRGRVPIEEKFNRFLATVANFYPNIGDVFDSTKLFHGDIGFYLQAAIFSGSEIDGADRATLDLFVATAKDKSFFSLNRNNPMSTITMKGWAYIEDLGVELSQSNQIFVAMWFGSEEQSQLYSEAIEPAIRAAGYAPVRIDNTEHNEKIDDQILAEIRKSKAVVVDMTCGLATPTAWSKSKEVGAPRGGVFYEAGFATGLGLPVIWTVKSSIAEVENVVHFDVRQFNQIRWNDDLDEFAERLRFRIEATLGKGNAQID